MGPGRRLSFPLNRSRAPYCISLIQPLRRTPINDYGNPTKMRLRYCLLALIVLPLTCMAAGSGQRGLARCLSGPVKDCDYTLIARAYDNIVPETVAKPNSEQKRVSKSL